MAMLLGRIVLVTSEGDQYVEIPSCENSARVMGPTHSNCDPDRGTSGSDHLKGPTDSIDLIIVSPVRKRSGFVKESCDPVSAHKFYFSLFSSARNWQRSRHFVSIFEFGLLSRARPEEFLAVQWRDLNLERNTVQLKRVLVRHKRSGAFRNLRQNDRGEPLPFPRA
jgi:hypothetical protein